MRWVSRNLKHLALEVRDLQGIDSHSPVTMEGTVKEKSRRRRAECFRERKEAVLIK